MTPPLRQQLHTHDRDTRPANGPAGLLRARTQPDPAHAHDTDSRSYSWAARRVRTARMARDHPGHRPFPLLFQG
jgi:hypothetical protein